ncbi:MAG: TlpA family protein disulfide reductase [Planctomycetota bacterium]|nr:MAG: TlpA family protein disulfide reductase [Planctomycetota bacterium]
MRSRSAACALPCPRRRRAEPATLTRRAGRAPRSAPRPANRPDASIAQNAADDVQHAARGNGARNRRRREQLIGAGAGLKQTRSGGQKEYHVLTQNPFHGISFSRLIRGRRTRNRQYQAHAARRQPAASEPLAKPAAKNDNGERAPTHSKRDNAMFGHFVLLAVLLVLSDPPQSRPASGERLTDVREIVRRANDATRAVEAVAYTARTWSSEAGGNRLPPARARVIMADPINTPGPRFLIEADADLGARAPFRLTIASDGIVLTHIDRHARRAAIGRVDRPDLRLGSLYRRLLMREYSHPAPFEDELNGETLKLEGVENIAGHECYVVFVQYARRAERARWYFDVNTLLPRRVDRISSGFILELSDINLSPDVHADMFLPAIPRGFELTEILSADGSPAVREPPILPHDWPAPNWELTTADGERVSLKQFAGQVVVIDFWSTWAQPCAEWMPHLQAIHDAYKSRGVVVLGLSTFEPSDADPAAVMRRRGCTYRLLLDADDVYRRYRVPGVPTTLVIGRDGHVRYADSGINHVEALRAAIEEALSDSG